MDFWKVSSKEVKILGIKINNKLNFNNHIKSICRKASQKLSALPRISSNLNMKKKYYYINQR